MRRLLSALVLVAATAHAQITPGMQPHDHSTIGTGGSSLNPVTLSGVTVGGTTGTGNIVFSASPTFSGTLNAAALSATGRVAAGINGLFLSANSGIGGHSADTGAIDHISGNLRFFSDGINASTPGALQFYTTSSDGSAGGLSMTLTNNAMNVGANVAQTSGAGNVIAASGSAAGGGGDNFEFGHANTAGFRGHLGSEGSSGANYLAFHSEINSVSTNTYTTRGVKGSVIRSDNAGGWRFTTIPTASAANQAGTDVMTLTTGGALGVTGTLSAGAATVTTLHATGGATLDSGLAVTGAISATAGITDTSGFVRVSNATTPRISYYSGGVQEWVSGMDTADGNKWKVNAGASLTGAPLSITTGGAVTIAQGLTLSAALTYGGVTAANSVTGTGSMVLSAAPTITGHPTIEGVTSTGATGTGNLVFASSPTLTTAALGSSTATTQSAGDNSTKIATTAYADTNFRRVVCEGGAQVVSTNTTGLVTLATCSIPGGAMGANGHVLVELAYTTTNSANSKTVAVKYAGSALCSATTGAMNVGHLETAIHNRNATNSQVADCQGTLINGNWSNATTLGTSAIDSTAAQNVTITCQMAALAENCNLERYAVLVAK